MPRALTPVALGQDSLRRARFVREYLIDLDGAKAYRRAFGYTGKNARQLADQMLRHPDTVAAVVEEQAREAVAQRDRRRIVDSELVWLATVDPATAFGPDGNVLHPKDMPEATRRALASFECEEITANGKVVGQKFKVKFWDKKGAIELIGKREKLFVDRVEHSAAGELLKYLQDL